MKFTKAISLLEICQLFDLETNKAFESKSVTGINEINRVESGDICFVDHPKYFKKTINSAASYVLCPEDIESNDETTVIKCDNPFDVYNKMAKYFYNKNLRENTSLSKIDSTAIIDPSAIIEKNVSIGAHTIIDANVVIKEGVKIGSNVKIEANTSIGTDAFYYHKSKDGIYTKWFSCGNVIIKDDAEIGALCTINRGVSASTIIGKGTKLDCHIQIGHGVEIGENCLICAQVGISGKTIIGNNVIIYGQVGITQNLKIGDGAKILAQSGVGTDVPAGQSYFGSPAIPARDKMREIFAIRKLGK